MELGEKELKNMREVMEVRFEDMDKHFTQLQWNMSIGFTVLAALMAVFIFF